MMFRVGELIKKRRNEKFDLYDRHVKPWMNSVPKKPDFERVYVSSEGGCFWDDRDDRHLNCVGGATRYIPGCTYSDIRHHLKAGESWS